MIKKTAQFLDRSLDTVSRFVNGIGSAAILGMVLLMAVNVILRYVFGRPIKGTVELEEFMLVVVVFLGLAYTAVQKRHVRIDFIISRFSRGTQAFVNSLTSLLSVVLCLLMVWRGVIWTQGNWAHQNISVLLHIPIYIFAGVAVFGCLLLLLVLLSEFLKYFCEVIQGGGLWPAGFLAACPPFLVWELWFGGYSLHPMPWRSSVWSVFC